MTVILNWDEYPSYWDGIERVDTMDEYCKITGISRRTFYRRLSRIRRLFEELLNSDSVELNSV